MLTFYFWLSQRRVRSLQAVSRDHIDLYTEASVYGQEWATEAPQRLVKYLQHCRENDEELPKEKRLSNSSIANPSLSGGGDQLAYC